MQDVKGRLLIFLNKKDIGWAKFSELTGLSRGFISTLKNNVTAKTASKIENVFPELSINWLLTGDGPMLKSEPKEMPKTGAQLEFDFNAVIETNLNNSKAIKDLSGAVDKIAQATLNNSEAITELIKTNASLSEIVKDYIEQGKQGKQGKLKERPGHGRTKKEKSA